MLEGSPRGERGITRRRFLLAAGGTLLAGGVAALGSYGYAREVEPRWLAVEHVALPLPNLSPALAGFKVVLMGDFHLHPFTQLDLVHRAVRLIARLQPDLILLVGDYVLASAQSIWELAPLLATMSARYGIMAVLGNHDLWTDADLVGRGLEQAGISLLVNQGRSIAVGGEALYVAGLDDGWSGHPDLERALAGRPEGAPVLLLIHEPDFADLWAQDGRVAVQLSGHSHGGQVRLPGIGALILPRYALKYDCGLYRVGQMWLYTTRGIGVIGPLLRWGCRPEITAITLQAASGMPQK